MFKTLKDLPRVNYLKESLKEPIHFQHTKPTIPPNPSLISVNQRLLKELSISVNDDFGDIVSGKEYVPGTWSLCYGGHQFKQWAGQLGDGRAHSLGQYFVNNQIYEIQLKGAGKTPYSRFADGLAVLRSSIREYLCAEAMHYLRIPTSRSLALSLSGESVQREEIEPGAVVARVAPSWIRFGSFEILFARQQIAELQDLVKYCIKTFHPDISPELSSEDQHLLFLEKVVVSTADMIAHWQSVGFCHGVMNTDNFSILGLTIDYGPFQFMDQYDPFYVCNHSDDFGIYAFMSQPQVGQWNLLRLGNALMPLFNTESQDKVIEKLKMYSKRLQETFTRLMAQKLGFESHDDKFMEEVIQPLMIILENGEFDYHLFFRMFSEFDVIGNETLSKEQYESKWSRYSYASADQLQQVWPDVQSWYQTYRTCYLQTYPNNTAQDRQAFMKQHNPKFILRNSIVDSVIKKATEGDYSLIDQYLKVLQNPFEEGTVEETRLFGGLVPKEKLGMKCSCSS